MGGTSDRIVRRWAIARWWPDSHELDTIESRTKKCTKTEVAWIPEKTKKPH